MPQYSGIWTLSQAAQAIKNQDWAGVPPTVVEYLVVAGGGGGGSVCSLTLAPRIELNAAEKKF
jgi:hypothetical protein